MTEFEYRQATIPAAHVRPGHIIRDHRGRWALVTEVGPRRPDQPDDQGVRITVDPAGDHTRDVHGYTWWHPVDVQIIERTDR
jgi:hypothetical protein